MTASTALVGDERLPRWRAPWPGEPGRDLLGDDLVGIADRHDLGARHHLGEPADVVLPDHAGPDDSDAQRHGRSFSCGSGSGGVDMLGQYGQRRTGPRPQPT